MWPRSVKWLCLVVALWWTPVPVAAQGVARGPRPSFIFFRYASRTSLSLYAGYGTGSWLGFLALVQNPRSEYREAIAGIGKRIPTRGLGDVTVALAAADAKDSRYLQLYVLPSLSAWNVSLDGTAEFYGPLEARGSTQWYLNPLTLSSRLSRNLRVGVTYLYFGQQGDPAAQAVGPHLRLSVPNGTVGLDLVCNLRNLPSETRITFQTGF